MHVESTDSSVALVIAAHSCPEHKLHTHCTAISSVEGTMEDASRELIIGHGPGHVMWATARAS
jgi:hypothetical protein